MEVAGAFDWKRARKPSSLFLRLWRPELYSNPVGKRLRVSALESEFAFHLHGDPERQGAGADGAAGASAFYLAEDKFHHFREAVDNERGIAELLSAIDPADCSFTRGPCPETGRRLPFTNTESYMPTAVWGSGRTSPEAFSLLTAPAWGFVLRSSATFSLADSMSTLPANLRVSFSSCSTPLRLIARVHT